MQYLIYFISKENNQPAGEVMIREKDNFISNSL